MRGSRPLTQLEVDNVTTHLRYGRNGNRNAAFFTVGLMTGFRVSELCSIDLGDVFQHGSIPRALTVHRANMKGQREGRTIVLNKKARGAIQAWLDERGTEPGPLWNYGDGKRITRHAVHRFLTRAFAYIGLTGKLGTHCMRKTFAERMYELLDADLINLQKALGHKWVTSTSQYLSFKEEVINDALDAL
jgi:site-specific recombinase XerD